jgi:RimJ/RimL family protein N-acetyltransferase
LNNIDGDRGQAELRFWVGRGVERRSDAVEWSAAVVGFAWTALNLNRIYALQLGRHPLAGRVLADIGMQREGLLRRRVYKGGPFEDVVCWAIVSPRRNIPESPIKRTSKEDFAKNESVNGQQWPVGDSSA